MTSAALPRIGHARVGVTVLVNSSRIVRGRRNWLPLVYRISGPANCLDRLFSTLSAWVVGEACQFPSNFFPSLSTASVSCLHVQVEPQAQVSLTTKTFGVAESKKRANGKKRIAATYRLLWLLCHLFLFWLFRNSRSLRRTKNRKLLANIASLWIIGSPTETGIRHERTTRNHRRVLGACLHCNAPSFLTPKPKP